MGQVRAVTSRQVGAPAQAVFDALADYAEVRPRILPSQYSGFAVREGGVGAGTVAQWRLQAPTASMDATACSFRLSDVGSRLVGRA